MSSWLIANNKRPRRFINNTHASNDNISPTLSYAHSIPSLVENNKVSRRSCYEPYLFPLNDNILINRIKESEPIFRTKGITKIVNVYKQNYRGVKAKGLGDFIRGSYCLAQICQILNLEFDINFKYHPLSSCLANEDNDIPIEYLENIKDNIPSNYNISLPPFMLSQQKSYLPFINNILNILLNTTNYNGIAYVYTIAYPLFIIDDLTRLFIGNKLEYISSIESKLNTTLITNKLTEKIYNIIHVRSGDIFINGGIQLHKYSAYLNSLIELIKSNINYTIPNILLCDSSIIKEFIKDRIAGLITLDTKTTHLGENTDSTQEAIIDTMTDFYICSTSASILSISCYDHGSGFTKWCAETYNIPYKILHLSHL
jgi:hypothetical protein